MTTDKTLTEAAIELVDRVIAMHWHNATLEGAAYDHAAYERTRALLLAALAVAFPDLDADEVYEVWIDCNENAAYCADVVRERAAYAARERAELDAELLVDMTLNRGATGADIAAQIGGLDHAYPGRELIDRAIAGGMSRDLIAEMVKRLTGAEVTK